ncbi:MAG: hypothetical protein HYS24_03485 [Ignavibacteriales bacterium]|nr:hypothetical protein [Ignavibacteriales bacterium]
MSDHKLNLPESISPENINSFLKYLSQNHSKIINHDRIFFNISDCKYISPAGFVVLTSYRDILNEVGIQTFLKGYSNSKVLSFFGLNKLVKIPIKFIDDYFIKMSDYVVELKRCNNGIECAEVQKQIIEKVVQRTNCEISTKVSIDYMINEIWDNAGVHGYKCYKSLEYPKPIYIAAFSFHNRIEIAILDRGQGIHSSLKVNKKFEHISAKDALKLCIKDKISGHPNNSPGFGLYSATELVKGNYGKMFILSSKKSMIIDSKQEIFDRGYLLNGTLIILNINSDLKSPFEETIKMKSIEDHIELMQGYFDEN